MNANFAAQVAPWKEERGKKKERKKERKKKRLFNWNFIFVPFNVRTIYKLSTRKYDKNTLNKMIYK